MSDFYEKHAAELRAYAGDLIGFTIVFLFVSCISGAIGGFIAWLELGGVLEACGLMPFRSYPDWPRYALAGLFCAMTFITFWSGEEGPPRWRPCTISQDAAALLGALVFNIFLLVGIGLAVNSWLRG